MSSHSLPTRAPITEFRAHANSVCSQLIISVSVKPNSQIRSYSEVLGGQAYLGDTIQTCTVIVRICNIFHFCFYSVCPVDYRLPNKARNKGFAKSFLK